MTYSHDCAFPDIYDNNGQRYRQQVSCFLETTELAAVFPLLLRRNPAF
jgi:hypothetical protein